MASETHVVVIDKEAEKYFIDIISSIDGKLSKLSVDTSDSYDACIHKVSQKLRKANEAAYTPRVVSIGPLHHELAHLQSMESYKLRLLQNFLTRFGIGLNTLVRFAQQREGFVRGCYEGTVSLSPQKFIEMILLDGIFIVELFLENHFVQLRDKSNEILFEKWMYNDLLHDMLLLENQLPIRVIKELLSFVDFSFIINEGINLSIYDLAKTFFKNVGNTQKIVPLPDGCYKARHFVEFMLVLHSPAHQRKPPSSQVKMIGYTHTTSAAELQDAGVEFHPGEGDCLFEVVFEKGKLTIPRLTVNDSTETFFRNVIAFEQCGYGGYNSKDITSYVILMDSFINTSRDVDLLVKCGIIKNELGESSQMVADLFNNLHKEVVTEANVLYFAQLCRDLNYYSKDWVHKWKAKCFRWYVMLRKMYFSNPWSFISVLAALTLLVLTVIQTVCSILQVQ